MSSILANFLQGLSPPPFEHPDVYTGWEYKYRIFVFRPGYFSREVYLLLAVLFYAAIAFYGKLHNTAKADSWFSAHKSILNSQFSRTNPLTRDGYSDAFIFSTGRRGVAALHTIFTLRPRHDLFQWAFQIGRTFIDLQYRPRDRVELDATLAPGTPIPDFVWAIVAKEELQTVKDDRWDLTLTRTTENAALPPVLSVMSEFADVTDSILRLPGAAALLKALSDPAVQPYFRSLTVTDQPRERPTAGPLAAPEREKHVILSLTAPPASQAAVTSALVASLFPLIDSLPKIALRPETKTKLKRTREDIDKELKEEAEREKKEEATQAAEDKKAAKRKAEEERISKLSAAEQQKALEREKKRLARKQQSKQAVRK